jgi:protein-S-isoprenylcysteine O-methyltransferase Ste14
VHPYFAENSVTLTIAVATVLAWFLLEFGQGLRESVQRLRHRGNRQRHDRGSYLLLAACIVGAFAVPVYSTAGSTPDIPGQPIPFVLGVVGTWGGIVLRFSAFRALGRYFTFHVETRADQPVIATGPYRLLRHPSYTAIWLILVGFALMCGTWIGLAATIVLPAIGFSVRIRVEERALIAELGEAYIEFSSTRKRLIPFIW